MKIDKPANHIDYRELMKKQAAGRGLIEEVWK
jgi:hypothetical protein